eukprot:6144372-Amphidinium_carterae.1
MFRPLPARLSTSAFEVPTALPASSSGSPAGAAYSRNDAIRACANATHKTAKLGSAGADSDTFMSRIWLQALCYDNFIFTRLRIGASLIVSCASQEHRQPRVVTAARY